MALSEWTGHVLANVLIKESDFFYLPQSPNSGIALDMTLNSISCLLRTPLLMISVTRSGLPQPSFHTIILFAMVILSLPFKRLEFPGCTWEKSIFLLVVLVYRRTTSRSQQ